MAKEPANKFMINETLTIHSETEKEFENRPSYALIITFIAKKQIDWVIRNKELKERLNIELKKLYEEAKNKEEFNKYLENKSIDDFISILQSGTLWEKNFICNRIRRNSWELQYFDDTHRRITTISEYLRNESHWNYDIEQLFDFVKEYIPYRSEEGYTTPLTYDIISQAIGCSLNIVKILIKELIAISLIERKQTAIGYLYRVTDEKFLKRAKEIYKQEEEREKCMI